MTTIKVPPMPRMTDYARICIESGHVPGVLSGANLRGKARKFGASYATTRGRVARHVARYGAASGLVLIDSRWVRVWVARDSGARVQLEISQ